MGYLDYPGLQRYHGKVQEEIDELKDDLSQTSNTQTGIMKNAGAGNDINDYLYKYHQYLDYNLAFQPNDNINLYRFPCEKNGFVIITWESDQAPWGTIGGQLQVTFQNADGTFTRDNVASYTNYSTSNKTILIRPNTVNKYVILAFIPSYVSDISLYVNSLYGNQKEYLLPNGVIPISNKICPVCPLFLTDGGQVSSVSGYDVCWRQVHTGDTVYIKALSPFSYTATFTGINGTKARIYPGTYSVPEDGIMCFFDSRTESVGHYLVPAVQTKVNSYNVLGISESGYSGQNGVAFGTSLTYRSQTTGGFLQYLPNLCGITFDNQGVGSATILAHSGNPDMLTTITGYSSWSGKRVCLLEGFVNDWYYNGASLGTWKDTGTTTVCGCVRNAISHILTQNANLTMFLILDHYGKGITAPSEVNSAGDTQLEFYQEIEKVALSMGVRVIKEYELSEISDLTQQYLLDNIHMNDLGAKQSANAIWSGMKNTYPNEISA